MTVFYYDYVGALLNGPARQANLYAPALRADQFEKSNFKGLSCFIRMIDQVWMPSMISQAVVHHQKTQ